MTIADYIMNRISDFGIDTVFTLTGGGCMHLTKALAEHPKLKPVYMLHEQACAFAADAYARMKDGVGACLVTSGPGGTNAITGCAASWIDSVPVIFVSGQCTRDSLIGNQNVRQVGVQEINIRDLVKPITKYALQVNNPHIIEQCLRVLCKHRPGPVWLDVPLDIQNREMPTEFPIQTERYAHDLIKPFPDAMETVVTMLEHAERPLIVGGHGIRLAHAVNIFNDFIDLNDIPCQLTWGGVDLLADRHPMYFGRHGIFGQRYANNIIQQADVILFLGTRLAQAETGYDRSRFAPNAKKIIVDVDSYELDRWGCSDNLLIHADVKSVLESLQGMQFTKKQTWMDNCKEQKQKYPIIEPVHYKSDRVVNSYVFIDQLSEVCPENATIITDMGTSFTCTFQTWRVKQGQRIFTAWGLAPMGYGLPGAIGAYFADKSRPIICLSGDGGLQLNLQELQTIKSYKIPLKLFVFNNQGYIAIRNSQMSRFGKTYGADLELPNLEKLSRVYGLNYRRVQYENMNLVFPEVLNNNFPYICEIVMSMWQEMSPTVKSQVADGKLVAGGLERME